MAFLIEQLREASPAGLPRPVCSGTRSLGRPGHVRDDCRHSPRVTRGVRRLDGAGAVRRAGRRLPAAAGRREPPRSCRSSSRCETLHASAESLRDLLAVPEYRSLIDGRQEVMVGYSDSAKDGGRLAANWALYTAQEELVAVARDASVQLTLFHGRGGSVSRGGGPTYLAIQSQPPGSIEGRLRVTEQGEMIQAQFGLQDIAVRTLELYTTATLDATLAPAPPPQARWRQQMDALAGEARSILPQRRLRRAALRAVLQRRNPGGRAWRDAHRQPPRPQDSRQAASKRCGPFPGSLPGRRPGCSSRPGWAPVRPCGQAFDRGDREILRELYREWPFFRSTIDLIAMVLAKADSRIAAEYDRQLVPPDLAAARREPAPAAGTNDRRGPRGHRTQGAARRQRRAPPLDQRAQSLRRSDQPGTDRAAAAASAQWAGADSTAGADPKVRQEMWSAFMITVNGIAAGMRNTG